MTTTFMQSPQLFFTSESVTEGHPDKVCDQISDAILDAILTQDPTAHVACESSTSTDHFQVFGEVSTSASIDVEHIARDTIRSIGYDRPELKFDGNNCQATIRLNQQSPDIKVGVDKAQEVREDHTAEEADKIGAGDQGMMIGFACDETEELMPLPIALAHGICRELSASRRNGSLPYLRPDGKAQVTVEYRYGAPHRVDTVVVSAQHDDDVPHEQIERDLKGLACRVIEGARPGLVDEQTKFHVNPTGRFVIGGPHGDAGLTGRKIIVDTYGGMARHGGGAFSGKDPTKVDRSAAYYARYVAKNCVAAGLAKRLEIQVSYAIGIAHPTSIMLETFGTGNVPDETIRALIDKHFDFRPRAIIRALNLQRPIYRSTAAYGHFGRHDIDAPWESTDKADQLRQAVAPQRQLQPVGA